MTCQHPNPVGYVFCSTCGQSLEHQRCRCGFVCAGDALYCGRCGHLLSMVETDDELTVASAVEHRYNLDLLVKLANALHTNKRVKIDVSKVVKVDSDNIKPMLESMKT
ncbi:MAG: zinc ribbon domain-containing protein [Methylococcales bacterium]|nr:zinc ribbon domain-containing protein [Methylococcales bacterium]MDD5753831.1 zinc ribbon domain-containing protein [Methylococcales bacterium]